MAKDDRAPGLHASDLLDPLKSFWSKIDPQPVSERFVWLFLIGRVLHHFVLSATSPQPDGDYNAAQMDVGAREALGIVYSPDNFTADGFPIEFKTNRSYREPALESFQEEHHIYLEQLAVYMVLSNTLTGYLWILYINLKDAAGRTWPEPRCYRVEITEEQFADLETKVLTMKEQLTDALTQQDPTGLPLCRAWLCGSSCAWWGRKCRPQGRWPEPVKKRWSA